MKREEAIEILQGHIDGRILMWGEYKLPKVDVIVHRSMTFDVPGDYKAYTFGHLMSIAYPIAKEKESV